MIDFACHDQLLVRYFWSKENSCFACVDAIGMKRRFPDRADRTDHSESMGSADDLFHK
ncbi:hypothetical protein DPMN_012281 [Dreissena polymorpha]|uniref:Uncharacterized protein n=1 Tax=Dreissena polymorpha TaxID=45954 RepID=A0A9D4N6N6_DREPO|nr:hypothetical protein DPMN_012281 [Dreissena polymorpha]